MFNKKKFGANLKQLRESNHLKINDITSYLNINKSTISNLENGVKAPSINMLIDLATYFNVSIDFLIGRNKNLMHMHMFFGSFGAQNRDYQIEILMPSPQKNIESVMQAHNFSTPQFEKQNGHIILVIYSDWKIESVNGKCFQYACGDKIDIIHWEDWHRYKVSQAKNFNCNKGDPVRDYLPCSLEWDKLFDVKNIDSEWKRSVETHGYSIYTYIE